MRHLAQRSRTYGVVIIIKTFDHRNYTIDQSESSTLEDNVSYSLLSFYIRTQMFFGFQL